MSARQQVTEILTQRTDIRVATGMALAQSEKLSSNIVDLDDLFQGGMPLGAICEWGCPPGLGGRQLLLSFLAQATHASRKWWCLWVNGHDQLSVYPPAWQAQGVDLRHLRFADSREPVADLRPVFLDGLFRVVVLDAPQRLSKDDCAFLAQQAREQKQLIIIVRNHFLSPQFGNVWARYRLNCRRDGLGGDYEVWGVRGVPATPVLIPGREVRAC